MILSLFCKQSSFCLFVSVYSHYDLFLHHREINVWDLYIPDYRIYDIQIVLLITLHCVSIHKQSGVFFNVLCILFHLILIRCVEILDK